ncbi:hypothetical protein BDV11DRAFT_202312 [Aspergillus similis]
MSQGSLRCPKLLECYSRLRAEDIRDEAFQVCPYHCTGQMRILSFHLSRHPLYKGVIRFLAHQRTPSRQLFGRGIGKKAFTDLGYRLFRDKDWLGATFTCGNLTGDNNNRYRVCQLLLHLWNYETQLKATTRDRHNIESLKDLWHHIGQATHIQWEEDASLEIDDSNMRVIWWKLRGLDRSQFQEIGS